MANSWNFLFTLWLNDFQVGATNPNHNPAAPNRFTFFFHFLRLNTFIFDSSHLHPTSFPQNYFSLPHFLLIPITSILRSDVTIVIHLIRFIITHSTKLNQNNAVYHLLVLCAHSGHSLI